MGTVCGRAPGVTSLLQPGKHAPPYLTSCLSEKYEATTQPLQESSICGTETDLVDTFRSWLYLINRPQEICPVERLTEVEA